MKYELISPESARALEGYIPKYVLENPGFDSLFFYAAVEESGGAVGLAAVDPIVDGPELLSIGISPDYEGKGYGSEAFDRVIEFIRTKPFGDSDRVVLTCNKDNTRAMKLYESKGFSASGNEDGEEIEMVMTVNQA